MRAHPLKRSGPTCASTQSRPCNHQPSTERMTIMADHSSATPREHTPHVNIDFSQTPEANEADSTIGKIEALAEIICRAGDESAGALLVLMGKLQNSAHPKVLANTVKHLATEGRLDAILSAIGAPKSGL